MERRILNQWQRFYNKDSNATPILLATWTICILRQYAFSLGGSLICWCSTDQGSVSTSTAYSEIKAVNHALRGEIIANRGILTTMGWKQDTTTIEEDNRLVSTLLRSSRWQEISGIVIYPKIGLKRKHMKEFAQPRISQTLEPSVFLRKCLII